MPPSRLSEVDKQTILDLYQRGQETTTTLASRYSVSNSTVIRVLKSFLSSEDYEALVQSKRSNGRDKPADKAAPQPTLSFVPAPDVKPDVITQNDPAPEPVSKPVEKSSTSPRRQRPRNWLKDKDSTPEPESETDQLPLLMLGNTSTETESLSRDPQPIAAEIRLKPKRVNAEPEGNFVSSTPSIPQSRDLAEQISAVETELLSDLRHASKDLDEEEDEDLDDSLDDEDFDDEGEDDGDDDEGADLSVLSATELEIFPLDEGHLPRTCYLVIDRTAELVTRPLKDFGALGKIPNHEEHDRILPVFDNHRIARRFSNRNQRIIKVPDGKMLSKASPQLQAKGITRLLIDGRVYTL